MFTSFLGFIEDTYGWLLDEHFDVDDVDMIVLSNDCYSCVFKSPMGGELQFINETGRWEEE